MFVLILFLVWLCTLFVYLSSYRFRSFSGIYLFSDSCQNDSSVWIKFIFLSKFKSAARGRRRLPLSPRSSPSAFGNTLTVLSASTLPTFHFLHPPFHLALVFAYFLIFPDFRFVLLPLFSWILVFRAITFYRRGRKKWGRDFLTLSVLAERRFTFLFFYVWSEMHKSVLHCLLFFSVKCII